MKTKTLLLTTALGVAGAATTIAQVYSVNAVGYVNTELVAGKFNMISNPLDAGAGNNTVEKLLATIPNGTILYKFVNGAYENPNAYDPDVTGGWDNPDQTLEPGEGAFVLPPEAATVTFVGEVVQGVGVNAPTIALPAGFAMVSSKVPQTGKITTDLGYPVEDGDLIFTWDPDTGYSLYVYDLVGVGGWDPDEPVIEVGEAFWSQKSMPATWVREFSVNQ